MYGLVMYGLRYAVLSLNTRVRRGRDRHDKGASDARGVSTHASAGDATKRGYRSDRRPCSFNSRVREGRDLRNVRITCVRVVSTHASAGDATLGEQEGKTVTSFNSRVRGGRDLLPVSVMNFNLVSTHASAGDATDEFICRCGRGHVSTHASAGDATALGYRGAMSIKFQLTRPRGTRHS